jgi:hypothetical protein
MPSVDDIRVNAFPTPVYTAAGDVAKTCIRVYVAMGVRMIDQEFAIEKTDFDAVHREHDSMFCYASLNNHDASQCFPRILYQPGNIVARAIIATMTAR